METGVLINRPVYDLYDPNLKGDLKKHYTIKLITFLLFLGYLFYTLSLAIQFVELSALNMLYNLILIFSELLLGYYSLFLLIHVANGYKPIKQPLEPKITHDDIKKRNVPKISILIPLYREPLNIVKHTIQAALDINYPKDKFDITLVEDTPPNKDIQELCNKLNINYILRDNRHHFKAGAVNFSLPKLSGDYVLFIDADHILESNIIYNCLLSWRKGTIAVQTRIDFVNTPNLLTTVGAYLQIQFFSLFQRARRATGSVIFAGGGALFDRELLLEEGGLNPLTIADDTDTSFILRSRNHRIEFIDTIGVWALIPWDPLHLIRQIWRWLTGVTRSFRARVGTIYKGSSPRYVKVDHISTAVLPTMSLVLWLSVFLRGFLIIQGKPILTVEWLFGWDFLGIIPLLVPLFSIITGIIALIVDNKSISYKSKSKIEQILGLFGFYILMFAAQPFLIGAILKGLFGTNVSFNRTPKEKKVKDAGLSKIMRQYFILSIFLTVLAGYSVYSLLNFNVDGGNIVLSILYFTMIFPLIISFLWYWKLETYLESVEGISALNYIKAV